MLNSPAPENKSLQGPPGPEDPDDGGLPSFCQEYFEEMEQRRSVSTSFLIKEGKITMLEPKPETWHLKPPPPMPNPQFPSTLVNNVNGLGYPTPQPNDDTLFAADGVEVVVPYRTCWMKHMDGEVCGQPLSALRVGKGKHEGMMSIVCLKHRHRKIWCATCCQEDKTQCPPRGDGIMGCKNPSHWKQMDNMGNHVTEHHEKVPRPRKGRRNGSPTSNEGRKRKRGDGDENP